METETLSINYQDKVRQISETEPLSKMNRRQLQLLLKEVVQASFSIAIGQVIQYLVLTINLSFAGRLKDTGIQSGIGLANVVINCTGSILVFGLNQGFGSLAARAKGAKDNQLLKKYLVKAVITMFSVAFILGFILIFIDKLLIVLGQDPTIVYYAQIYSLQIYFGLTCYFIFDLLRNYLNAIGYFQLPTLIQLSAIFFQYIQCLLYCSFLNLELLGIVIATTVSYIFQLLLIAYQLHKIERTFFENLFAHFSDNLDDFKSYFKYVLPFALPMVIEMLSFEINSIFAGTMSRESYFSAHIILCSIVSIFYSFPFGLGGAICSLSSKAVGQNDPQKAKNYYQICLVLGSILGIFFLIVFILFDLSMANLYTNSQEVIQNFTEITTMYRVFVIVDNLQASIQGSLKSIGKGKTALQYFIISYYCIGTPMSYFLGFTLDYKLRGLWLGFYFGITTVFILQLWALIKVDWVTVVQEQYHKLIHVSPEISIHESNDIELSLIK